MTAIAESYITSTIIDCDAVVVREDIMPRRLDPATVEHYQTILDELDPIEVQRDTLVLIAGRHRLEASKAAGRASIRAIERDVPDDQLYVEAVRSNAKHGKPFTNEERREAGKRLLTEHAELRHEQVAAVLGVAARTVERWQRDLAALAVPDTVGSSQTRSTLAKLPTGREPAKGALPKPTSRKRSGRQLDFLEALDDSERISRIEESLEDIPDPSDLEPEWAAQARQARMDGARVARRNGERWFAIADRLEG